jgi:serine/threonine protein kinase
MLNAGTRLGPYEILTSRGAGGMGEVYKTRDTRLDRSVAIKSSPLKSRAIPICAPGSNGKRAPSQRSSIRISGNAFNAGTPGALFEIHVPLMQSLSHELRGHSEWQTIRDQHESGERCAVCHHGHFQLARARK